MMFIETMEKALLSVYIETFGREAWDKQTEEERRETMHNLLGSFLTTAKEASE